MTAVITSSDLDFGADMLSVKNRVISV